MTLLEAVDEAGGFTESAGPKVWITHFDSQREIYTRGGTNAPPFLEAGDQISVPVRIF